jgi:hypothetical protein
MKLAIYIVLGVAVLGMAYSLAPDINRYLKIKSM